MNLPVLPRLADTALEGMGASLPPHISIQGNAFTLIDGAGNQKQIDTTYLDVVIVDLGGVSKRYMDPDKPWTPDSNDPPLCWSANGVRPSPEAQTPQARTCAECPQNKRGSKLSMEGVAIKACRDERWMAFIVPVVGTSMIFRFVLTPGSFDNWKSYAKNFEENKSVDFPDVITRIQFFRGKNGVVTFECPGYADDAMKAAAYQARIEKKTDVYVGRDQAQVALPPPVVVPPTLAAPEVQPSGPFEAAAAPAAISTPSSTVSAPFATTAVPAEPAKRTRRTKAQIEADKAANGHGTPFGGAPAAAPLPAAGGAPTAPFRPAPPPVSPPAAGTAPFGIASQGVAPNPELKAMLDSVLPPPGPK